MPILVNHCYNWVSFHLVNKLLEKGYTVIGIDDQDSNLNEHLSMFLGRNSSFIEKSAADQTTEFQAAIIFGAQDKFKHIQTNRLFNIDTNGQLERTNHTDKAVNIRPPMLFGQWMPMNEKGMYNEDQFIPFESPAFLQNAVFVGDFVELLTKWLEYAHLSFIIELYSSNVLENKEVKLENVVYIHDNIPINEKLENVLNHFRKFNMFYERQ